MGLNIYISIMLGIILAVVIGVSIALYLFRRNLRKARAVPEEVIKSIKQLEVERLKEEGKMKGGEENEDKVGKVK